MTDGPVRYGMIGCGEIAVQAFDALMAARNATLAATFDVKQELAEDLAGRTDGAVACRSQDELLARDDVEAVIVSTPHYLHAPIAVAALEAGKHALVEKPIASSAAEAQRMVEAAAAAGRRLGCCFVRRYAPVTEPVRRFVAAGHLGDIFGWVVLGMGYKEPSYWTGGYTQRAKTVWRMHLDTAGGGFLIMNTIHTIDVLRYITGQEVVAARASGGTYNSPAEVEVEDLFGASVTLSGGGTGIIAGGSSVWGGGLNETRIIGTKGQIVLDGSGRKGTGVFVSEAVEFEGHELPAGEWTEIDFTGGETAKPRTLLIEGFGRWVRGEEEFLAPGEDALKTLQACEAIYRDAGLFAG
jgi:UDP-N-acetyl-2-amino-2-deoxyglucuronate dehydrogenase